MLSQPPIDMDKVTQGQKAVQALRTGIIAELDAASYYEQLAASINDTQASKVFLDVAKEEKTHAGEFLAILNRRDEEQAEELVEGEKEVEELLAQSGSLNLDGWNNWSSSSSSKRY